MADDLARWSRAAEVFHDARERPASERGAFLEAACGGDPALRAEVEALLAADAGASGFLAADGPSLASLLLEDEAGAMAPGTMLVPTGSSGRSAAAGWAPCTSRKTRA